MEFRTTDPGDFPGRARTDWDPIADALLAGKAVVISPVPGETLDQLRVRARKRMYEKGIRVTSAIRDGEVWMVKKKGKDA